MLSRIWRFLVALFDWRTSLRHLSGQPIVDVVFITNMRDEVDRERFLGNWEPPEGHFNGPRYWFGNIAGRTRALCVTAKDLTTLAGRKKAKEQFVSAVDWAREHGTQIVLLAAGTKRLFGEQAEELKRLFPGIIFTIGDNGTTWLLRAETLRALQSAGLVPGSARVCIIGPTGLLGESMVAYLAGLGYNIIGLCSSADSTKKCDIEAYTSFEEVGKVDAVIACTHADAVCLAPETVEVLRKEGRKLLVVDVAEPSNMKRSQYRRCQHVVIRQDAGNAYSPRLTYVLGAASYKLFRLTQGVTFGCFAEAITIASELAARSNGDAIRLRDWLTVSERNISLVESLFAKHGFGIPSPRCFGKPVTSFDLKIDRPFRKKEVISAPVEA